MKTDEVITWLADQHEGELVVTGVGSSTAEWHRVLGADGDRSFHNHAMGLTGDIAIGLALAQPRHGVWAIDGDGSLTINLGVVLTMAMAQPPNLVYMVVSNRLYGTFGQPIVNSAQTDYAALVRGAGIESVHAFADLDDLRERMPDVLRAETFSFVVLEVEPSGLPAPPVPYEGPEIKYRFARHVEDVTGDDVLGPFGY